ncbi:hypothetical protein BpHYR1_034409 [Brachionus plicatilis]|uniref:Uncharacterized protein n=1 Tax=Brachionus plicatilis TaxID=10195 RepID=A0A3M7QV34_BRAPC|nr:hypothetical protein BpHYR1_034409 [Brachionus plicatilis]
MLTELDQFFLVTPLPPVVNWVRPYWISRDIHHIETLTLCYCLRMLGKWVEFLDNGPMGYLKILTR